MATWLSDVITGLEYLNGVAPLSAIYRELRKLRPEPHPPSFDAIIRRTLESNSSDSEAYNEKNDIFFSAEGLGAGIWGLRSWLDSTPIAIDISNTVAEPGRCQQETYRILRDTNLARQLKVLYQHKCQICGSSIVLPNGNGYAEAHHIKPLGTPHNGPDCSENIVVLCPNHHVMLDYGVIKLQRSELTVHPKHDISEQCLLYHNEIIWEASS